MPDENLIPFADAMARLRMSEQELYDAVREGEVRSIVSGRDMHFREADLTAFAEARGISMDEAAGPSIAGPAAAAAGVVAGAVSESLSEEEDAGPTDTTDDELGIELETEEDELFDLEDTAESATEFNIEAMNELSLDDFAEGDEDAPTMMADGIEEDEAAAEPDEDIVLDDDVKSTVAMDDDDDVGDADELDLDGFDEDAATIQVDAATDDDTAATRRSDDDASEDDIVLDDDVKATVAMDGDEEEQDQADQGEDIAELDFDGFDEDAATIQVDAAADDDTNATRRTDEDAEENIVLDDDVKATVGMEDEEEDAGATEEIELDFDGFDEDAATIQVDAASPDESESDDVGATEEIVLDDDDVGGTVPLGDMDEDDIGGTVPLGDVDESADETSATQPLGSADDIGLGTEEIVFEDEDLAIGDDDELGTQEMTVQEDAITLGDVDEEGLTVQEDAVDATAPIEEEGLAIAGDDDELTIEDDELDVQEDAAPAGGRKRGGRRRPSRTPGQAGVVERAKPRSSVLMDSVLFVLFIVGMITFTLFFTVFRQGHASREDRFVASDFGWEENEPVPTHGTIFMPGHLAAIIYNESAPINDIWGDRGVDDDITLDAIKEGEVELGGDTGVEEDDDIGETPDDIIGGDDEEEEDLLGDVLGEEDDMEDEPDDAAGDDIADDDAGDAPEEAAPPRRRRGRGDDEPAPPEDVEEPAPPVEEEPMGEPADGGDVDDEWGDDEAF